MTHVRRTCPVVNCGLPMYLDRQALVDASWLAAEGLQKPIWWRCPSPDRKHDFWEHPGPTTALTGPVGKACEICHVIFRPAGVSLRRHCDECKRNSRRKRDQARKGDA